MQQLINDILHDMSEVLSAKELYTLQLVLQKKLNTQNNQTYNHINTFFLVNYSATSYRASYFNHNGYYHIYINSSFPIMSIGF